MDKGPVLAEKYAKALFDYAVEHDCLELVYAQSVLMLQVFELLPEALDVLYLPIVPLADKIAVLQEAADKSGLEPGLLNFLKILVEKKRIKLFSLIQNKFRIAYNLHHHKLDVELVSARPMSEEEEHLFLHIWGSYLGMFLNVKHTIDESLIDGIKVYYKGYCFDASLKRRLELLREEMGKWN